MSDDKMQEIIEFHWLTSILQIVDVGLVVLDSEFKVKIWNGFMESHSGLLPSDVRDQCLFTLFPDIREDWFKQKARPVFELKNRSFMTWEQRPYLFKFPNYRPITGPEDYMYQNITLTPIVSPTGTVDTICMMIYDVTDVAAGKKLLEATQVTLIEREERD